MKSLIKEMLHAVIAGDDEKASQLMNEVLTQKSRVFMGVEPIVEGSCEYDYQKNDSHESLTEGLIRHVKAGLARSHEHFGSMSENPDKYRDFRKALDLLDAAVPKDTVYAYTPSEFPTQFRQLVRKLGLPVTFDEMGDVILLKSAGFEKVGKRADTTFYKKENVMFLVKQDAECTVLVVENE